jgi:hypothetical protein
VTGGEQDTAGGFADADDMAGSRSAENAMLSDDQFLDSICSTDLCNQLRDLWVPIPSITTNDKERSFYTFGYGQEDRGNEGLAVVGLLEDGDLLSKA